MRPHFIVSPGIECELDPVGGRGTSGSSDALTASVKAMGSKGAGLPKKNHPGSLPQFRNLPLWLPCISFLCILKIIPTPGKAPGYSSIYLMAHLCKV